MNIAILHLVDGTEIIATINGRSDGQLGLTDARSITFNPTVNAEGQHTQLEWSIRAVHPLQAVVAGFQPLTVVRGDNILYTIPQEVLPPTLLDNYRATVAAAAEHLQQLQAAHARQLNAVQRVWDEGEQPVHTDDGSTETQA